VLQFGAEQGERRVEEIDVAEHARFEQQGIVDGAIAAQRDFIGGAALQIFAGHRGHFGLSGGFKIGHGNERGFWDTFEHGAV